MILALRALGIGDFLTAVPALRAVRRAFPATEVALAAPVALAPLIQRAGIGRLVPVPTAVNQPPVAIGWSDARPLLAVNLHGCGPQSTQALRRLSPEQLWSYGVAGAPVWDPDEHEVRRWCRLVEAYGCLTDPADLYLGSRTRVDGPVIIHPGAARVIRRWPVDRYAVVARGLADRGCTVQVTAGPGERGLARAVAAGAGLPDRAVTAGVDVGRLADLVRSSQLVVCGDTGIAHLATAYQIPSVVLFGPQPPGRWGPPAHGQHRVLWRPDRRDGAGHRDEPHPALLRIQPADVLAAVMELL